MNQPLPSAEMDESLATGGRHGMMRWLENRLIQEVGTGAPSPTRRAGFATLEEQHDAIQSSPYIQTAKEEEEKAMLPSQKLRKGLGMTFAEFAMALGVSMSTLHRREVGKYAPYKENEMRRMMTEASA